MDVKQSVIEKGGGAFAGIKLLLCENPLPPMAEAVEAAARELPRSNFYTEQYSQPLKEAIADYCNVPPEHIHVNAGSEIILRQLMTRFGRKVHLIVPTFALFEETGGDKTRTYLQELEGFQLDLRNLDIPEDTTFAIIVNPNNPNGVALDLKDNLALLQRHPRTMFLVDEAFIEFGGKPVADLVPHYSNLIVTRTFSKGFSLAGLRVGYAIASKEITDWLNTSKDAYPLTRPSQAAALACLQHRDKMLERIRLLQAWTRDLARQLEALGIRTFPTTTYFFLGKVPNLTGDAFVAELRKRDILVKALHQPGLGEDFVRFTTSTPANNKIALDTIKQVLGVRS
ncbi:MAG: pyridoxal phosphate-dependent aminotransferase [Chloroflexota bacterium]